MTAHSNTHTLIQEKITERTVETIERIGGNVEVMAIHEICKVFVVFILYLKAK
jgi:hypothetical protein